MVSAASSTLVYPQVEMECTDSVNIMVCIGGGGGGGGGYSGECGVFNTGLPSG